MGFDIVQGDLSPAMPIDCTAGGAPASIIDAVSMSLEQVAPNGTVSNVTLYAVDLTVGKLQRRWSPGDTDVPGIYRGRVKITLASGAPTTYPADGTFFEWEIHPSPLAIPTKPIGLVQSDVTGFAPELCKLWPEPWVEILAYVNQADLTQVCETIQTDRLAKIYLAAHMGTMTLRSRGGAAGPLTSRSAGGLRQSFGLTAIATGSALGLTGYGQMYLEILGATGIAVGFVA